MAEVAKGILASITALGFFAVITSPLSFVASKEIAARSETDNAFIEQAPFLQFGGGSIVFLLGTVMMALSAPDENQ